jgi:amino acid transporter
MSRSAEMNFVKQQGIKNVGAANCEFQFPALMLQPRLIGILVVSALLLQSAWFFLLLSALLWWNVLLPALNPFDTLYNNIVAAPRGMQRLGPAPAPRRFAQGMAATFMLSIGISLLLGWLGAAWILQAMLVAALAALIFGKFCLGSYLFHLIRGDAAFANRTLPWAEEYQGEEKRD